MMPATKQRRYVSPTARRGFLFLLIGFLSGLIGFGSTATASPEAKEVVAIQLRAQGIPCTNPTQATKDLQNSTRDEMVWELTCKEATYRVRLIPHIGAKVDIIDAPNNDADTIKLKE